MDDQQKPLGFSFHIEGGDPHRNAVPATILAHLLQNTQRAFELIGFQVEGRAVKQRARVGAEISERFKLLCEIPKVGCYEVPVVLAAPTELHGAEQSEQALGVFKKLMASISQKDRPATEKLIPDEGLRRRVLESIRSMSPQAGDHWSVDIRGTDNVSFGNLDSSTSGFVKDTLVPPEQREEEQVLVGELSNIAFTQRKFTIIFKPTKRELECIYDESLEDLLYDCRRALIQVTGRVLVDEAGNPQQLIGVTDVRNLDLSLFTLNDSTYAGRTIACDPPLLLNPTLDETEQLLCLEDEALGINVFAQTREGLLAELNQQLDMLWCEFAHAHDDSLDSHALTLKSNLLARFREAGDAA
jgi:hypothetical protein